MLFIASGVVARARCCCSAVVVGFDIAIAFVAAVAW
jgi:hypothetical protein